MLKYLKQRFKDLMMCFEPTLLDWLGTLEEHEAENCIWLVEIMYKIDHNKRFCNLKDALNSLRGTSDVGNNYIDFLIKKYCYEL